MTTAGRCFGGFWRVFVEVLRGAEAACFLGVRRDSPGLMRMPCIVFEDQGRHQPCKHPLGLISQHNDALPGNQHDSLYYRFGLLFFL